MKKKSIKSLIRTCDNLFREYIKLRDKCCQRCHVSVGKLETAHFYSRSYKQVRFDPDNACLLCFKCHFLFAHMQPLEFVDFWIKRIGDKSMENLSKKRNEYRKMDYEYEKGVLQERIKCLK